MSESSGRGFPPQPPPTKSILVYRNGDAFYPGKKFVINQRQTATFESFLGSVTRGIEAPFGAVRHIYTPREGHRIRSLEQFSHGERYVAAGAERLKNIEASSRKPIFKEAHLQGSPSSRKHIFRELNKFPNSLPNVIVFPSVFANGDILVPPARILLPKYTLNSWESVLAMVTEKVHLRSGAVHRLCTLDGTPLLGTAELKNNQYYVAVGMEKFRHKPYVQNIPNKGLILDINQAQNKRPLKKDQDNIIKRMMDDHKPSNQDELLEFLHQEWHKVIQKQCVRLVEENMPRCMKTVKKQKSSVYCLLFQPFLIFCK
uniref:Si:dkey-25g12.4 n=1 Tax=Astyanax mexicanus TaxID=7994 RepID=A0A8B9LWX4_ASTMX